MAMVLQDIKTLKAIGDDVDDSSSGVFDFGSDSCIHSCCLQERVRSVRLELSCFVHEKKTRLDDDEALSMIRWCKHQSAFPTMASDVAITLTSAASKRVFSLAGNAVLKKRNRLGVDLLIRWSPP